MDIFLEQDIEDIVEIHLSTLSNDLLPQLGSKYLFYFYKYLLSSDQEFIFINKINNKVIGICIVSIEPKTLLNRVLKNTFFFFFYSIFTRILYNKLLQTYILNMINSKNSFNHKKPEIVYILTKPEEQGKGIGKKLLHDAEKYLASLGFTELFVKTSDLDGNKAIDFYKKNHFVLERHFMYAKKKYIYFKRCL